MNKRYKVHADFRLAGLIHAPTDTVGISSLNYLNTRGIERLELDEEIELIHYEIPRPTGEMMKVYVVKPALAEGSLPCMIHYHGGGFMLKASPLLIKNMADYAKRIHCVVVIPDYRLLPDHPFPAGFDDAYNTLMWVYKESHIIGIDRNRLVIAGDSAGGALAAGTVLKARDVEGPKILMQLLLYPVTDYTQSSKSMKLYWDAPVWNAKKNNKMWSQYLPQEATPLIRYASPLSADSFKDLPPAYIEVAEFDCLRDEGIALAEAYKRENNHVTLVQVDGGVHGYDNFLTSTYVDQFVDRRIELLKKVFA